MEGGTISGAVAELKMAQNPTIPMDHVHALSEACAKDVNRFQAVAKRYLDDQPRLVRFFRDNMPNMPEKSGEVSLYLLAVILHIFYKCGKVGKVGEPEILRATQSLQVHARGWLKGDVYIPDAVRAIEGRAQPGILDEAMSALFERTERRAEEVDIPPDQAARMFLMLWAATEALNASWKAPSYPEWLRKTPKADAPNADAPKADAQAADA